MARAGGLVSMLSLRKRVGLPSDLYRSRLEQRGISVESARSACQRVQACVNKNCARVSFAKQAKDSSTCACRRCVATRPSRAAAQRAGVGIEARSVAMP